MVDDFYLNLISWSYTNTVAVALGEGTYIWKASTGAVVHVGDAQDGSYVSSVDFSNDGAFLAIGMGTGDVELWDVETHTKLRTMGGHQAQVAAMSWNAHLLSSGCGDGSIWHHDVRIARHKVMEMLGHTGEVCGLKWRPDGEMLASGGNDNVVNVWDGRVGDVGNDTRGTPKWTKRNHTAAVKVRFRPSLSMSFILTIVFFGTQAVGWCPWQPSLLATGGGTNDAKIHVWNTTTGARIHTIATPAQVTSLHFAPHKKEILSTHGYPTNSIMIHAYPSLERVAEIRDAHESRVLFSCVSPAGDMVCTGAGDENLKFWKVWEVPKSSSGKKKETLGASTSSGILAIR